MGSHKRKHLAVVIHGYYLDQLQDLLKLLPPGVERCDWPELIYRSQRHVISSRPLLWSNPSVGRGYVCLVCRMYDVAPFLLHALPVIVDKGIACFETAYEIISSYGLW